MSSLDIVSGGYLLWDGADLAWVPMGLDNIIKFYAHHNDIKELTNQNMITAKYTLGMPSNIILPREYLLNDNNQDTIV